CRVIDVLRCDDTAASTTYALSLHDALPIYSSADALGPDAGDRDGDGVPVDLDGRDDSGNRGHADCVWGIGVNNGKCGVDPEDAEDRKSTRLNSSHVEKSYAVFCLEKHSRCD